MRLLNIFKEYKLFEIFILGIISGMPLQVIVTAIITWLRDSGVALEIITTFAVAKIFYSIKFIWAPIVDYLKIPILSKIGHRKSWMLLCTAGISIVLFLMSKIDPAKGLLSIYILAIILGFCSATSDINVDAFRIERLTPETLGIGTANAALGYRIGMTIISVGSFYYVDLTNNWSSAFVLMSMLFVLAMLFILSLKETETKRPTENKKHVILNLTKFTVASFKNFFTRDGAVLILLAIVFFKMGDALLAIVSGPFYLELGYTKAQIATIAKLYGLIATIAGTYVGGMLIFKVGNFKGLIIGGLVQSLTNAVFIWLAHQPTAFDALLIAITIENFAGGVGTAALVAYISILCNRQYTATQYALLSSSATLCNSTITMFGGKMAMLLGWDMYFALTIVLGFPSILIFMYLNSRYTKNTTITKTPAEVIGKM